MVKLAFLIAILSIFTVNAQSSQVYKNKKESKYEFKPVKNLETTPIQDQGNTGTCWSFSTLSFFESELIRQGKKGYNLSEMYVARRCYEDKGQLYVRMHGTTPFAQGGAFHDVTYVLKKYGMVPEEVYKGLNYGEGKHNHTEVEKVLQSYLKGVVEAGSKGKISTIWKEGFMAILDTYFGKVPEQFTYNGKNYTPQSYAKEMGLNPDDYIEITSFSHHPFYTQFMLEVPDNWLFSKVYNVPLNELSEIMEYAIQNGYTVAWAADVSEKGFSFKNGVAIVPEKDWSEYSKEEIEKMFNEPVKQRVITQEMRQLGFDNYETQDDHGMHIVGLFIDQLGQKYYLVKNSWGDKSNECDGFFFASDAYFQLKTTCIMLHKKAVSPAIAKKLGLSFY